MNSQHQRLRSEYQAARDQLHAAAEQIENADRPSPNELDRLESAFRLAEQGAEQARDRLELFERTQEARRIAIPDTHPGGRSLRVTSEPLTYERGNPNSMFRDMVRSERGDVGASERLASHMREMQVEAGARFDLSSTDAAGGYLVAPLYLQDEFVALARAGRPLVNAIGSRPLPPSTDVINLPKMSTGTAVAVQADNAAVQETDAAFGTIASDVKTIAGMQDVSRQLLDRGVPGVDEVIFADLSKAYNSKLESDLVSSATANYLGLLGVSGTNTVTYTDGTPTVGELYPKLADAINQVNTGIFLPPTAIFMHPRRWAWMLAALDTQNRPLITPYAPLNAAGVQDTVLAEGAVGSLQGLPVYISSNIPTTLNTDQDRIIVTRTEELFVWEAPDGPYLETFHDVGSGTLTVRFRLHNYVALQLGRLPKAISVISGTGLTTPAL